jgi:hypothetical protein
MILCSRILRTVTIATSAAVMGIGSIAAIAPSAAAATGAQLTASRLASHSPRQPFVAECQGDVLNATETRSGERKYVDFDTWVECIAVGVGIDEMISWIRLEFYFIGPSGRGQWFPVTGWRERYFAGVNETKRWNNQSWECEGAYDGQFRAQAYAKAYLSNGAVIRFPARSEYATSREPVGIDC